MQEVLVYFWFYLKYVRQQSYLVLVPSTKYLFVPSPFLPSSRVSSLKPAVMMRARGRSSIHGRHLESARQAAEGGLEWEYYKQCIRAQLDRGYARGAQSGKWEYYIHTIHRSGIYDRCYASGAGNNINSGLAVIGYFRCCWKYYIHNANYYSYLYNTVPIINTNYLVHTQPSGIHFLVI